MIDINLETKDFDVTEINNDISNAIKFYPLSRPQEEMQVLDCHRKYFNVIDEKSQIVKFPDRSK